MVYALSCTAYFWERKEDFNTLSLVISVSRSIFSLIRGLPTKTREPKKS